MSGDLQITGIMGVTVLYYAVPSFHTGETGVWALEPGKYFFLACGIHFHVKQTNKKSASVTNQKSLFSTKLLKISTFTVLRILNGVLSAQLFHRF